MSTYEKYRDREKFKMLKVLIVGMTLSSAATSFFTYKYAEKKFTTPKPNMDNVLSKRTIP